VSSRAARAKRIFIRTNSKPNEISVAPYIQKGLKESVAFRTHVRPLT
jgi:hypothetical protein